MTPKNKKTTHGIFGGSRLRCLLMLLMIISLVFSIAACSERIEDGENGGGGIIDDNKDVQQVVNVTNKEATEYIKTAVRNLGATYANDEKWLNVDFAIAISFNSYAKVDDKYTSETVSSAQFEITVKAALNLEDNAQSALVIELRDIRRDATALGFYYYCATK